MNLYVRGSLVRVSLAFLLGFALLTACGGRWQGRRGSALAAESGGPAGGGVSAGLRTIDVTVGGLARSYDLYVPANAAGGKPVPLVLNFHGGGSNPKQQREISQMNAVADANGFVVVYPAGTSRFMPMLTWNVILADTYATENRIDDLGYVRALLDDVANRVSVDPKRVYATGYSQGAMMCYRLACAMADRFAAIAPVSGTMTVSPGDCHPSRPVPILHFHGLEDQHVPYAGGIGPKLRADRVPRPGVDETIRFWLGTDHLGATPTREGREGAAQFKTYQGASGLEVTLWTLTDGGHTWPGGGETLPQLGPVNRDIRASDLIWSFFRRYELP